MGVVLRSYYFLGR